MPSPSISALLAPERSLQTLHQALFVVGLKQTDSSAVKTQRGFLRLSNHEQKVLNELRNGKSTREISKSAGIKVRTVKKYIRDIAMKWGIDGEIFHLHVRIVYLDAVQRGLI